MPRNPRHTVLIDTAAVYYPLPLSSNNNHFRTPSGLTFRRGRADKACNGVFTAFEISRLGNQGMLQKPLNNANHQAQNNTNYLTLSRAKAAIGLISAAYASVLSPADMAAVKKWGGAAAGRWVRLDVAYDLPAGSIPTLCDIRRYLYHGRGAGARTLQIASPDGVYMYDKRRNRNVWRLKNYGTHITQNTAVPDFFASDKALTSALSTGQITIYVGSANAKIAIYSKNGKIRHEIRLKKSPLKKSLPGRDIGTMAIYGQARHLLQSVAARISELYGDCQRVRRQLQGAICRSLITYRPVKQLRANIRRYFHFLGEWSRPNYNNVTLSRPVPVLHPPRPPPFQLIQLNNRSSSQPMLSPVLLLFRVFCAILVNQSPAMQSGTNSIIF
ncbi:MAG: hypothetical protein ACLUEQ_00055 [Cloacibacillus evryensis]